MRGERDGDECRAREKRMGMWMGEVKQIMGSGARSGSRGEECATRKDRRPGRRWGGGID